MIRNSRAVWCFLLACSLMFLFAAMISAQDQHIFDKPYSGGYLAAKAFKEGRLQLQGGTANRIAPPSLTCSPAPCAFTPVDASEGGTSPVNEDPIVVNPTNPMNILTGGNDYNCSNIQGYFASTDGGTTWNHTCSGGSGGEGDPIVGFDGTGKAFAGGIQNGGIAIAPSTNGGMKFGTFKQVIKPELGYLSDKPWMEVDAHPSSPFKNNIYISTTQFSAFATSQKSQIWVAHSSDGGLTFTDVPVSAVATYPGSVNQFSDLAVGVDGTVYLNWINCPTNGVSPYCGNSKTSIMFSKSTDGGMTWSSPAVIASAKLVTDNGCCFYGQLPNTSERVSNIPSNGVFGSGSTAIVYVAFYNWNSTQMKMHVVNSADGGTTWGTPVTVNPGSTKGDEFFQWLNVNPAGTVGVTWLDRRNDPSNLSYQPFFAYSKNLGKSFSMGLALSQSLSNPNNDGFGGSFMGDYTGNAWGGTKTLYQAYMDTTTNTCQDFVTGVQFP